MKKIFKYLTVLLLPLVITSCGEEQFSKGTLSDSQTGANIITMSSEDCGGFHYDKPPVDILYVVDNSGSTNNSDFNSIKGQIANTINTISSDFDYHIYVAPLFGSENISSYPLIVSDQSTLSSPGSYNIQSIESLNPFGSPQGNNLENGFDRVKALIDGNSSTSSQNKIFRKSSNLIVVMISTGDDNSFCTAVGGVTNCYNSQSQANFQTKKNSFLNYLNSSSLDAEVLRFISLVPHSNCSPFQVGTFYKKMSQEIYDQQGITDDGSYKDSRNLCTRNYASIFQAVNNSIQKVLVGHTYNRWVINPNNVTIEASDIILKKKLANGSVVDVSTSAYSYIGYHSNYPTRILPDVGEEKTGLMVEFNGSNNYVTYPECIIAKTRTPNEYYGYVALSRKPDLTSVIVKINGNEISQSSTNGWSSYNSNLYTDILNIKVVGPTDDTPATPAINKSGYILKLNGSAIYSNSQTIDVYYKPADL